MKKTLKIELNGTVLCDSEFDEVVWNDGPNGVTVTGRDRKSGSGSGGSALIELLSAAAARRGERLAQKVAEDSAAEGVSAESADKI